nr:Chain B, Trypsin inhibitor 1 [Helianthus annuus]
GFCQRSIPPICFPD